MAVGGHTCVSLCAVHKASTVGGRTVGWVPCALLRTSSEVTCVTDISVNNVSVDGSVYSHGWPKGGCMTILPLAACAG